MKTLLADWKDSLAEIGVEVLTGEADGTNLGRLLCDVVTQDAADMMTEFFGGEVALTPKSGWNDGQWYTVLLTRATLTSLLVFHYLRAGLEVGETIPLPGKLGLHEFYVLATDEDKQAFARVRSEQMALVKRDEDGRVLEDHSHFDTMLYYSRGTAGTRNRHEASGRVT